MIHNYLVIFKKILKTKKLNLIFKLIKIIYYFHQTGLDYDWFVVVDKY